MGNPSSVILAPFQLISAKAATSTVVYLPQSPVTNCCGHVEATYYVEFGSGTSAGAVVVETAHANDYAGTWANLGTANWAAASSAVAISVSGIFGAIRVRISTTVVGGTADVWAVTANA